MYYKRGVKTFAYVVMFRNESPYLNVQHDVRCQEECNLDDQKNPFLNQSYGLLFFKTAFHILKHIKFAPYAMLACHVYLYHVDIKYVSRNHQLRRHENLEK